MNKIGFTYSKGVDFGKRTDEIYVHGYIRSIPAVGAVITAVLVPEVILSIIAGAVSSVYPQITA